MAASSSGDYEQVVAMLAPDVELVSDGGGKRRAALRPMYGADKVARWLVAVVSSPETAGMEFGTTQLNGEVAYLAYDGDEVDTAGFLQLDENGLISHIYVVRNPDKLTGVPPRNQLC
jgi:RNA polymerase sigma-70 factor (ECF subfamily)